MKDNKLRKHTFRFSRQAFDDDLILKTVFHHNGDPGPEGIYITQKLILQTQNNEITLDLSDFYMDPHDLRELADELENEQLKANGELEKELRHGKKKKIETF
jgi:hypothetical protein